MDLAEVLGSWELHLRAERKSPQTVKAYGDGVRAYLTWCLRAGRPAVIDRRHARIVNWNAKVMGAALARMELQVATESLLRRFPGVHLAVPAAMLPRAIGGFMEGFSEVPVTW